MLAIQEHHLRNRQPGGYIRALPPLQVMERLLFQMIGTGFALLSAALLTGFFFLEDIFAQQLVHKTVLSIAAWVIFGVLLWGRWKFGWRGRTAIRWTLSGFIFLLLAYFGSKAVLELILTRASLTNLRTTPTILIVPGNPDQRTWKTSPLAYLFGALVFLLLLSAFFSSSETGLMTLNRYRLRHLARANHAGAKRAQKLLERPDRLIGLILLGNNFVNVLASAITTVIALRLGGEPAIAVGAGMLTLVILVFAEVTPKTLAALHPERVAFPAAFVYGPLLWLLYPLVWVVNVIANGLLRLIGVHPKDGTTDALSQEELRTVVLEAGAMIPKRHQDMLLNIIDLEKVTVEDIMVPRKEINRHRP